MIFVVSLLRLLNGHIMSVQKLRLYPFCLMRGTISWEMIMLFITLFVLLGLQQDRERPQANS